MSSAAPATPPAPGRQPRAGHTRISSQALTRTLEAITADAFAAPVKSVQARLRDQRGEIWVSVAVPAAIPPLTQAARNPAAAAEHGGSLYDRADAARRRIIDRARQLTGYTVGRVDIRLSGLHREKEAKLR